jgi:hypothetical protein
VGNKITGRKRHILVDTLGLLLSVAVHAANIQDRDGVTLPFIECVHGDDGYQEPKATAETGTGPSRSLDARAHHRIRSLAQVLDRRRHLSVSGA